MWVSVLKSDKCYLKELFGGMDMYVNSKSLGIYVTGKESKTLGKKISKISTQELERKNQPDRNSNATLGNQYSNWCYQGKDLEDEMDYTNLAGWSRIEWEQLDIYRFILANFRRYMPLVVNRIGKENFPMEAYEVAPSLFIDRGYKPLASVHSKNHVAVGERRNQIMLGSLREIARTRIVEAVIKEFPFHESIDNYQSQLETTEDDLTSAKEEGPGFGRSSVSNLFTESSEIVVDREVLETEWQEEKQKRLQVELVRSFLTNNQYQHFKSKVCEGKTVEQIALDTGKTVSNARITLKNARIRLFNLLTDEQQDGMTELVSKSFQKS